jgi:hypothetical protein
VKGRDENWIHTYFLFPSFCHWQLSDTLTYQVHTKSLLVAEKKGAIHDLQKEELSPKVRGSNFISKAHLPTPTRLLP